VPARKYLHKTVLYNDIVLLHFPVSMYTFHFPLLIYLGEQIKKNEMGGACGTYGEEERRIQGFGGEPVGESHIEGLGEGKIILCYTCSVH